MIFWMSTLVRAQLKKQVKFQNLDPAKLKVQTIQKPEKNRGGCSMIFLIPWRKRGNQAMYRQAEKEEIFESINISCFFKTDFSSFHHYEKHMHTV